MITLATTKMVVIMAMALLVIMRIRICPVAVIKMMIILLIT